MYLCVLCGLVFSYDFDVCPLCFVGHEEEQGMNEHLVANRINLKKNPKSST
jgi:hypothetical protein